MQMVLDFSGAPRRACLHRFLACPAPAYAKSSRQSEPTTSRRLKQLLLFLGISFGWVSAENRYRVTPLNIKTDPQDTSAFSLVTCFAIRPATPKLHKRRFD